MLSLLLLVTCALQYAYAFQPYLVTRQNAQGDTQCSNLMCVTATVNGTVTTYVLSSLGKQPLGWMGVGFGRQMANTPMVIMWPNSDGSVTLSQRKTPAPMMPTVDANPPRTATLYNTLTSVSSSMPRLAFTIPTNSDTSQNIIFAFGTTNPNSSAVDATLMQHIEHGSRQIDLAQPLQSGATTTIIQSAPSPTPTIANTRARNGSLTSLPSISYERIVVAQAVLCVLSFVFLV